MGVDYMKDKGKVVYLYKFTGTDVVEIKGYIQNYINRNTYSRTYTFREISKDGKIISRLIVSGVEGELYRNYLWLIEPNRTQAILSFKKSKIDLQKHHESIIQKTQKEIENLDNLLSSDNIE